MNAWQRWRVLHWKPWALAHPVKHVWVILSFWAMVIGVAVAISGHQQHDPNQGLAGLVTFWIGFFGLSALVLLWMAGVCIKVIRLWFRQIEIAATPIPSPAQIAFQLEQHLGRSPTVEEVAAADQMIRARRNEAAVGAGLGFFLFQRMAKHGHHR